MVREGKKRGRWEHSGDNDGAKWGSGGKNLGELFRI